MAEHSINYVLGIDLGANSLGWAALGCGEEVPTGILAAGVRVFSAGAAGLERGRDESNAAKRRVARLQRRQTDRRRRRIGKIYGMIAGFEMLPPAKSPEDRTRALTELDVTLSKKFDADANLPYLLRARALDGSLEPLEIGRALFHLAQRRGFLSNRKSRRQTDEERGKVRAAITTLSKEITDSGARTLGEFFARHDTSERRIRGQYTSRQMYVDEFEAIWAAQRQHHPESLTDERRKLLSQAIFFQRPLRDQSDLIGDCGLEISQKRAAVWHPLAQRFRLLQEANNMRLVDGTGASRHLDQAERALVIRRLESGDMTLKDLRNLLGLRRTVQINLDSGGKKTVIGDRTAEKMRAVFQHHWDAMSADERTEAINDLASDMDGSVLAEKAKAKWGLNGLNAQEYSETALETGKYLSLSLSAIERLLPHLEQGSDVTTARMKEYPETFRTEIRDLLPKVDEIKDIRNPAVHRSLSELRKVVNALIRRYGKPSEIHIELARELKSPRPEREKKWDRMRQLEGERSAAVANLLKEIGIASPSGADIEKWRLADECNWRCPYSCRAFSKHQLFGSGEVQVEHIIPFALSLDDSFANKTLAYVSANARKANRTPRGAFAGTLEWDEILQEVRQFKGSFSAHKLQRFQWTDEQVTETLDDFTKRQMNDTRYASRLAARYAACLYGGLSDESGKQRVFVTPGQVTAFLRRLWGIGGLLSDDGQKTRDDHRHHLVDAITVALTGPKWVRALSDAASQAHAAGRRRFASIRPPWDGFANDVRATLDRTVVSVRADRKVRGALHDETNYGVVAGQEGGARTVVRKPVHKLTVAEVERIVDERVRERVRLQLNILQQSIKKLENDPPTLPTRHGKEIKIRKARIQVAENYPRTIGKGIRERNVVGGDHHHFEILKRTDPGTGRVKWDFAPVRVQEAMERVHPPREKSQLPLVKRDYGEGIEFVCSIAKDETLEIEKEGARRLIRVRTLEADGRVGFTSLADARPFIEKNKNRERLTVAKLMSELKCRKVAVSPLGEVRYSRD
jgi:CRISPR-associated endonuclease Csn1